MEKQKLRTIHYKIAPEESDWQRFAALRKKYKNGEISHANYTFFKGGIILEQGSLTNLEMTYGSYFAAIMAKEEKAAGYEDADVADKKISDILNRCKEFHKKNLHHFKFQPDAWFKDREVNWEYFRPYDENYNCFDCYTKKTIMPWRFSDEDMKEFREQFTLTMRFAADGRDCSGTEGTSYMKFFRLPDKTIILHKVNYDV